MIILQRLIEKFGSMKKIFYVLATALLALAAVSCRKDDPGANLPKGVDGVTPLPEAVDLGIVSGGKPLLWASFNLGASEETGYGDYYAWGETKTKKKYDMDTYSYALSDLPNVLTAEYDAAAVKLGGGWRMPTKQECNLLVATKINHDYVWEYIAVTDKMGAPVKDAYGKDKKGFRIKYLVNGKSIFIPCAGSMNHEELYQGSDCYAAFWSTSRSANAGVHFDAYWDESLPSICASSEYNTGIYFGLNIRPVKAADE